MILIDYICCRFLKLHISSLQSPVFRVQGNSVDCLVSWIMGKRGRPADKNGDSSSSESDDSSSSSSASSGNAAVYPRDEEVVAASEPEPTSSLPAPAPAPVSKESVRGDALSDDDADSISNLPDGPSQLSELFDWANIYAEKLLSSIDDHCMKRFLQISEKKFIHHDAYSGLGTAALGCKIQLDALLRRVNRHPGFRFGNNKQQPFGTMV